MKTAAVVTVTNGKRLEQLKKCVYSIENQSHPVKHYVLCDHDVDVFRTLFHEFAHCNVKVCYWDGQIGGNGWAGQRWLSAAPHLITEDVTFFCNDDDWYEANHVESIMAKIEEGNLVCQDNCEALGESADVWNIPGHRFVDWCMWGMRTELLKQISIVLNNPSPQVDRMFYATAKQLYPNFTGTGLHTFNFRLGGSCGVQKEFFEFGNGEMLKRFNGKLPWILT